jgi:hypothetical protein
MGGILSTVDKLDFETKRWNVAAVSHSIVEMFFTVLNDELYMHVGWTLQSFFPFLR